MKKGSRWTAADLDAYQNKQKPLKNTWPPNATPTPQGVEYINVTPANFFKGYALYVGIDAGVSTGWAVWSPISKAFIEISTTDFWGVPEKLQMLTQIIDKNKICVVIEDPNLNKSIHLNQRTHISKDEVYKLMSVAQDVGSVKRESSLLIQWLQKNNWPFIAVRPTASKTKDAEYFKKLTGWQGRTNQHNRDAGLLVFSK